MHYIVKFKMKNRKHKLKSSFWNARMDSKQADLASSHCLAWNYL